MEKKSRATRAVPAATGPSKNETCIQADTSCEDEPCANSLLLAVAEQSLEKVAMCIAEGHSLQDTPVKGCTPLLLAVKLQNCEIVKLLVQNGASCSDVDANGLTVLHHAAVNGLADVVSALVVSGKALLDPRNLAGCTPLYQAVQHGHIECARALLGLGADLGTCSRSGATPLYIASDRGHLSLVELLLDAGADATVATELQMTPLLVAAFNGHRDVVLSLLSHKVDIEQRGPCGGTALYVAAQEGRSSVAECLLHQGAKVDSRCHGDLTPSLIAAMQGHDSLVRLLLEARSDLNVRSERGSSLAIMAARFGQTDCLKTLVDFGGPVVLEGENAEGMSALGASKLGKHNAATSYIKGILALQKEADLNAWEASLPGILKDLDPPPKKKKKGKAKQAGKDIGRRISAKIGQATGACSDPEVVVTCMLEARNAEADDAENICPAVSDHIVTNAEKECVGGTWMQVTRKGIGKPVIAIAPPGSPAQLPQIQPSPMLSPIGPLSAPEPGTPTSAQSPTKHGTTSPFGLCAVLPAWPSTPESWPHFDETLGATHFWPSLLPPPAISLDYTPEKATFGGNLHSNFVNSTLSMPGHCKSVYVAPSMPQNCLLGNFISAGTFASGELN